MPSTSASVCRPLLIHGTSIAASVAMRGWARQLAGKSARFWPSSTRASAQAMQLGGCHHYRSGLRLQTGSASACRVSPMGNSARGRRTVLAMYEAVKPLETDRVLVHSDVGLHNLAIDAASLTVCGLFDFDSAAWADRHHDFRYLLFDYDRDEVLEAAVAVYEPAVGCTISRARVALYNAVCAISFLAYRAGRRSDERYCGRTLTEDLRWTRHAVGRALRLAPSGG